MSVNPKDKVRVLNILDAILEIEDYNSGILFEDFSKNSLLINTTVRQFEIIGEASNHLSEDLKSKYSNIEWKQIIGLRHILIHEYFSVDVPLIWSVMQYDLPDFKNTIQIILNNL